MIEYPLLGEPPSMELANTDYGDGAFDFLGTEELVAGWLDAMGIDDRPASDVLRGLRDAAHGLFASVADELPPEPRHIEIVNRHARGARSAPQLQWDHGWRSEVRTEGSCGEATLRALAEDAIALLGDGAAIRRCAAPDCTMLFVRQHHLRRFCHPTCSGRTRQAAYVRRQRRG